MNKHDPEAVEKMNNIKKRPPSSIVRDIYKYQEKHTAWFLTTYGGFAKYFEESYDFYVQLLDSLNYVDKGKWGWPKNLIYIYLANSSYSLFKSYTNLLDGFYGESVSLSRVSYELLIKSIFIVYYPDDCWATYSKPGKGSRAFNVTNFLRHDLKVDWEYLYRLTSGTAHGKAYFTALMQQLEEKKKHEKIGLQLQNNTQMCEVSINLLTFLIWASMYLLVTMFDPLAPDEGSNKKVLSEANDYIFALGDTVKTMPNSFSIVHNDFQKIISQVSIIKKDSYV